MSRRSHAKSRDPGHSHFGRQRPPFPLKRPQGNLPIWGKARPRVGVLGHGLALPQLCPEVTVLLRQVLGRGP